MKTSSALILATALACGGGGSGNQVIDPAMAGTWTGTTTLTVSGYQPQTSNGELQIAVSGQDATFTQVCPGGTGSITGHGSGRSVSWQGSYVCPPANILGCPTVVLTLQSASATLNGSTLSAQGSGNGSGCGVNASYTVAFTGTK
jgi:hypothetical protein